MRLTSLSRTRRIPSLCAVILLSFGLAPTWAQPGPSGFVAGRWTGAWGSDGPIQTGDLNGDGKTDVFMWRSSDKDWTVNLSTGSGFTMQRWTGAWGSDGPIHTGDLNGDGKTDVFMWRSSDKDWTVNLSTGSAFTMQRWTGAWGSDGPIHTGDLNGDGKTDVFMWRDSDKDWTVNLSTGTGFVMQRWTGAWGSDGPIQTGDLNGDGKTDVFMWRNSDKDWTVNLSTGSGFSMQRWTGAWGSDGPIHTGDLNGDGKTDVFMWRGSDLDWTVNLSSGSGFVQQRWLGACGGDGPTVLGDFNGDKRLEVTVWRDDFKQWMTNLSTGTGFTFQLWNGAWGSDGPMLVGDLNGDARTDVFMWRDTDKDWTVNLSVPVAIGPVADAPACGPPTWVSLGPHSMTGQLNYLACAGKVDDLQISPNHDGRGNPAMYITAAGSSSFLGFVGGGGGIWRSSDFTAAKPTWVPLIDHIGDGSLTDSDRIGILDVPSLAVHPTQPRTLYAATNLDPPGLLGSTDGGDTWRLLARGQLGSGQINRVTVDPDGLVYVATTTGVYAGLGTGPFNDISGTLTGLAMDDVAWHSFSSGHNPFTVFVAAFDAANRDANSRTGIYARLRIPPLGFTWRKTEWTLQDIQQQAFASSIVCRTRLATTPGAGIAASMTTCDNNPGLLNVFNYQLRASNKARRWTPQWTALPRNSQCRNSAQRETCFYTAGGYTLGVAVAPDGRSYGGGIGLGQSDGQGAVVNIQDAGGGFVTGDTIHVDEHVVAYSPLDQKIYVGTDGGLFRFTPRSDGAPGVTAWESVNSSSLRNFLSESVAFSPARPLTILAGHQDNGIGSNVGASWKWGGGNEGEQMYFDPNDRQGDTAYGWDASNRVFMKSTDGGSTFANLTYPVAAAFALAFHPTQKDRFLASFPMAGNEFTVQETEDGWTDTTKLRDLAPPIAGLGAPSAIAYIADYRYVAAGGRLFQGEADAQGGVTWTAAPVFQDTMVVSVAADPGRPNAVYFATPAGVFLKENQTDGIAWTVGAPGNLLDLTGAGSARLPFAPSKLTLTSSRGGSSPYLYAATLGGVFKGRRGGTGASWARLGAGLPDVLVTDLDVNPDTHYVYASLFGRGVFYLVDYSR